MQHDRKLETRPFTVPFLIKKKSAILKPPQNNHKHGSRTKDFNKNTDTSSTSPPKAKIACHRPKVNSVRFKDPWQVPDSGGRSSDVDPNFNQYWNF